MYPLLWLLALRGGCFLVGVLIVISEPWRMKADGYRRGLVLDICLGLWAAWLLVHSGG